MNRSAASLTLKRRPLKIGMLAIFCIAGSIAQAQVQNTTTAYQYDANGNLTQITDPLAHVTNQTYDALNRLTQQTQPIPATGVARPVIKYAYDGLDQLSSVTDPRNLVTSYTVDGLGNQTALSSPDTGTSGATYDEAGNLKTRTDARGKVTTYTYDAVNRLTQISYATGPATTFTYDTDTTPGTYPKGRLVQITDESGSTHYLYDRFGRITAKTQTLVAGSATYTVSYQYGSSGSSTGHLTSTTYPSGNRINVAYDAAGRIANLTFNPVNPNGSGTDTAVAIPLLTGIGYAPFGLPISWTWGNSTATAQNTYARSIDLDGRITGYPLGNALNNGTFRTVAYDAASRIQNTTHTGSGTGNATPGNFNQSYGYDNLDRLTSAVAYSTSQGYQYDANGNRTQLTIGSTAYANAIAATSNQLTGTSGPSPAKTNAYDNAGNLTNDGSASYSYSDRGRLKSVTTANGTTSYLYNGLNQRVAKSSTSIATGGNQYVYDEAGHLIGEYDATGKMIEETVYLGDMPVAVLTQMVTGTAPNTTTTANVYYVYADHLNAPRVITRATDNNMVWRWDDADPFGRSSPDVNPSGLGTFTYNPRFPGQLVDQETNLFYNVNRDYDPSTGRYVEVDPMGLFGGSMSPYVYVNGNPVSKIDPFGLQIVVPMTPPPAFGSSPSSGPVAEAQRGLAIRMDRLINEASAYADELLNRLTHTKNARESCEAQCDADWDADQKDCEWIWKMKGRQSADYQLCISRANANYVACYQKCAKECKK